MEEIKNPSPGKSNNKEPDQKPNTHPSTGHHQPDIQEERSKKKRSNQPNGKGDVNPEEFPDNGNPEAYNDGEPVDERSPRASNSL